MTESQSGQLSPGEHARGGVLVVDDEAVIRIAATHILEYAGYEVESAIHGADALRILRKVTVDTILVDLQMPIMDGVELLTALRADSTWTNMRIVVMSADDLQRRRVLRLGAHAFLQKPFRVAELLRSVGGT